MIIKAFINCKSKPCLLILDTSSSPSKSSAPFPGVKLFMNQLEELLTQEQSRGRSKASSSGLTISMTHKRNSLELLLVGTHPVCPKSMEAHKKLRTHQEEAFRYNCNLFKPRYISIMTGDHQFLCSFQRLLITVVCLKNLSDRSLREISI